MKWKKGIYGEWWAQVLCIFPNQQGQKLTNLKNIKLYHLMFPERRHRTNTSHRRPLAMNKAWNNLMQFCLSMFCALIPYHVDELRDLESKAHSDGVIGVLHGPHPLLVTPEKVPQQGILHLSQRHKVILSWKDTEEAIGENRKWYK